MPLPNVFPLGPHKLSFFRNAPVEMSNRLSLFSVARPPSKEIWDPKRGHTKTSVLSSRLFTWEFLQFPRRRLPFLDPDPQETQSPYPLFNPQDKKL